MANRPPWSRTAPAGPAYRLGLVSASLTTQSGQVTGTMSYSCWSFQWVSATRIALITAIEVQTSVQTTFTTSQDLPFGLFVVRSFTAAPTGGTAATMTATGTTAGGAFDTNFGTSNFATSGDIRICTTAALTAGTGTIDRYPMRIYTGVSAAQLAGASMTPAYSQFGHNMSAQPIWLRNNEGLSLQPLLSIANGTANLYVTVEWVEMPNSYA